MCWRPATRPSASFPRAGFLFNLVNATIRENVRYGAPGGTAATATDVEAAFNRLHKAWVGNTGRHEG
ncbi:MAG: hypothetical protein OEY41_12795 [Acidimicrobiia bacterium]|nr:hypothetical protein [Acidimicrobiia bacterium]MDH4364946.1 hypothetical protein [Acidimicrobiia bacterium]MDH5290866.1 hypothetical protein [Acidimicrobiia bacterium]